MQLPLIVWTAVLQGLTNQNAYKILDRRVQKANKLIELMKVKNNAMEAIVDNATAPVFVKGIRIDDGYVLRHGYLGYSRDVTDVVDS